MNKILQLLLASLLCCGACSEAENSPAEKKGFERYDLKSKVKSYTLATFEVDEVLANASSTGMPAESMGERIYYVTHRFDTAGNLLEFSQYSETDQLRGKTTYRYDKQGNETEMFFEDGKGQRLSREEYRLAKGKKVESIRFDEANKQRERTTYKYNKWGKIKEILIFDGKDALKEKQLNAFDEKGKNLLGISLLDSRNKLLYRGNYKYDAQGNEIESLVYDKVLKGLKKSLMRYDEHGNMIELELFDEDNNPGDKLKYVYEYDKMGNWTQQNTYRNGLLESIDKRVFSYFE